MSRITRFLVVAVLVAALPALAQSVTVRLPAPPMPSVQVVVPAPVVVQPAPARVVVEQRTVYVESKGNRGKHKGQNK